MAKNKLHPIQMIWFIILELLLIFGYDYSKFQLWGYVYLYDLVLGLLTIYSFKLFIKRENKIFIWPIFLLIGISMIYLLISFIEEFGPLMYILRQYMLFGYLICNYIIFFSFIDSNKLHNNLIFLVIIGYSALLIQTGYHIYNFFSIENYFSQLFSDFNYYSLPTIIGILIFTSYNLTFNKNIILKIVIMFFLAFLLVTIGHHGSTILAFGVILLTWAFLQLPKKVRLFSIILVPIFIYALFFFLPQFQDVNSIWRLIYWKYTFRDVIIDYYGLIGHGFGGPFITQEIMDTMRIDIASTWMESRPEEQYLTPMHNSFLTIAYHIGLLPSLLLFIPALPIFKYYFYRDNENKSDTNDFLFLVFISITIWISFHVSLELPHISSLYWFIFFTCIFHFGQNYLKSNSWYIYNFSK